MWSCSSTDWWARSIGLVDEEQFGRALPVIKYTDVEDAITSANRLDTGLGASVWSSDRTVARAVAAAGRYGLDQRARHFAPQDSVRRGVKSSGYGLEFGIEGPKAVAEPRIVNG